MVTFSLGIYRWKFEGESFGDIWSIFLLSSLLGIPGYFYGFILLMIFLDIEGFDFDMIPNNSN